LEIEPIKIQPRKIRLDPKIRKGVDIKMNTKQESGRKEASTLKTIGFTSSIALVFAAFFTFGIGVCTPLISGPFSTGVSIKYPYTDILTRFPRDYFWMYPAILMMVVFVVYVICVDQYADANRKILSKIALVFACLSAGVLSVDYFIQVTVIQPSLINGELDTIGILTQYNPHGIFIALEEIGYIFMSISFLFIAPIFSGSGRIQPIIRWTALLGFILTVLSFAVISFIYGIYREYRFEVVVITINFIVLILLGILSGILFRKSMKIS
jgi:hypothetical protein